MRNSHQKSQKHAQHLQRQIERDRESARVTESGINR